MISTSQNETQVLLELFFSNNGAKKNICLETYSNLKLPRIVYSIDLLDLEILIKEA